jgi:branched-chain amino acid aminotransferase
MGPAYEIWLNGEYYPRDRAQISMLDRGFKLGDVVYDTLRTFDGRIYRLSEHLERFDRTLRYVRIDPGLSMASLGRLIQEVVDRNEPVRREFGDDYMISPIVTRGTGYRIKDAGQPSVSVFIDPIDFASYGPMYSRGARAVITRSRSLSPQQLDPKVKHFSRLSYVMADLEAADVDPQAFPIMLDMDGNVTESVGSNFAIVSGGTIRTPRDTAILQGVSRLAIGELAATLDIPVAEENLQPYDVYTADEAFLCSTPFCLLPVSRVDSRDVADGRAPGPVTSRLLAAWSEQVGLDIVDQADRLGRAAAAWRGDSP